MRDALRFERVRIRTLRSTYWIWAIGLLLCGFLAFGLALDNDGATPSAPEATLLLAGGGEAVPFSILGFAAAVIGVLAAGHEYRYGTILPTLTALPRRSALLGAKLVVVGLVSAAVAIIAAAFCWLVGSIVLGQALPVLAEPIPITLLGYAVLVMLYGLLGVALSQLTRSITAAIVIVLLFPLLVEPVIGALAMLDALSWLRDVLPYLPFSAGTRLVSAGLAEGGPDAGTVLTRWEGGAVFAGFVALVLAVAWVRFGRRDA